jgi:ribosomal protein S6--L-glutamate ligase
LHAENIEYFTKKRKKYVRFDVHPLQRNKEICVRCEALLFDERNVTSSSGHKEKRPVIETKIRIGKISWKIQLNLTNRDYMGFRMLLGRDAMHEVLIDPNHKMLQKKLSSRQILTKYLDSID